MKIAIISDIHGNLEALKTVLDDIKHREITEIYCLGDILAKGSNQQECLNLIKKNCQVIIRGNCDDFFTLDKDKSQLNPLFNQRLEWNHQKIDDASREYIKSLPFCHEFYFSGRLVRLVHAHPIRNDLFVGNIDHFNRLYELVLPSENTISQEKADILIFGHLHTPFAQKIYNRFILNPGSVGNALDIFRNDEKDGNPLNTTVANYMIITGNMNSHNMKDPFSFELISLPYDIDKELESNADNIELESYTNELKEGIYRDVDKINRYFELRGINPEDV